MAFDLLDIAYFIHNRGRPRGPATAQGLPRKVATRLTFTIRCSCFNKLTPNPLSTRAQLSMQ